ncbi:MAG: anaerobic glycerol-3-phosphate dehydrogenase subunit A [Chloroflexi bacterium]|nr:anaerobic glycerol-3-phosphate dehydrogenase subunit A [Chloroflexota bacterium]MCI0575329.1 anaerobic glycerol-3-phosphate dehydrogenase subunit A [Chloroflexota bacterium]MCI0647320.1 anaerobic glycerol-3-phosphate dehydrogenase subunit A [Chloroflexota bacterium]MCI0725795.1 anaerobic glycerol-3-phosphate dehydrogenase subunit A [Chloroflexota bacterium]
MLTLETEVLVIGGGATGVGVVQDLALRGFRAILVEKRDLTHGTTGRYHGLLHSGGRYAVKDPKAATECIEENRVLRRIMPHCLEDTGGFFVTTPWDDPAYGDAFLAGCRATGVPCEEISTGQMLKEEPLLNPQISRCFRVPDAAADSFLAARCVAESARQHGAQILNYHEVRRLVREGDRVVGVLCHDLVKDEEVTIQAGVVVNASGAWAGKIAQTIGLEVNVRAGKGTMIAANHRIVNTVINRCKMPADGDIIVPIQTVAVIGTTDENVPDPERFAIEPWEIRLMLEEGEKLVPGFKQMRMLRAWAGVRPLYQETKAADTRDITRAYTLLDHETRDGVSGFITITGGKWTTYRQMAEVTVDRVCEKLGVQRPCRTAEETLPQLYHAGQPTKGAYHFLGSRLARTEERRAYGNLVCECEMATYEDVERAIVEGQAKTFDDVRRAVRLGMGPCQGGFCTYRVTGLLHALRQPAIEETNVALRDFLQERWKGLVPILWGPQLKQERLDELIYLSVFNVDHLPGPAASRLAPVVYEPGTVEENPKAAR